MFGPNVSIFSENYGFTDLEILNDQPADGPGEVIIEDDVWLGTRSVILSAYELEKALS
jgi:acetyltransferase-like isoleucine patch superfamily enzyme